VSNGVSEDIKEKTASIIDKGIYESLKYITKSVTKMNVLLNGLLELSRLGQTELKKEKIDMNRLMSDVSGLFKFQITDAGIKLEISELPPCIGDNAKLNQVFSNLIGNSMKFLDPGKPGIIKVSGHQKNGQYVYCVEDNGIGIDPEYQDRIFEIFHQLEPRKNSGEGLGLAIVHKAVERHNGKVWVESEPGRGSRFYVSLPG
jgi:signal transduction histidine kinase